MVVTLRSQTGQTALRLVVEENRLEREPAPTLNQNWQERTALALGQTLKKENVTLKNAQVSCKQLLISNLNFIWWLLSFDERHHSVVFLIRFLWCSQLRMLTTTIFSKIFFVFVAFLQLMVDLHHILTIQCVPRLVVQGFKLALDHALIHYHCLEAGIVLELMWSHESATHNLAQVSTWLY